MKKFYRFFVAASLFAAISMIPFAVQQAQAVTLNEEICNSAGNKPAFCQSSAEAEEQILGESGIVTRVVQTLVYAVGIISVVVVTIGGLRYVLSAGDTNGTKGAKDSIIYALVGLAIAILAQVLVTFVLSKV